MKEKILATSENVKKIAEASGFDVKTVKKILILADVLEREVFMRQVAPQVRAKVFTDLRTRYAAAIDKMRRAGYDKAVPDQGYLDAMVHDEGIGKDTARDKVFMPMYHKAVYEGFMLSTVIFDDYKNEIAKG